MERVDAEIDSFYIDERGNEDVRLCTYYAQILFSICILFLLSPRQQTRQNKFQKMAFICVTVSSIITTIALVTREMEYFRIESMFFKIAELVYVVGNLTICYQLNDALQGSGENKIKLIFLITCLLLVSGYFYSKTKLAYVANIIVSSFALSMLKQIETNRNSKVRV